MSWTFKPLKDRGAPGVFISQKRRRAFHPTTFISSDQGPRRSSVLQWFTPTNLHTEETLPRTLVSEFLSLPNQDTDTAIPSNPSWKVRPSSHFFLLRGSVFTFWKSHRPTAPRRPVLSLNSVLHNFVETLTKVLSLDVAIDDELGDTAFPLKILPFRICTFLFYFSKN